MSQTKTNCRQRMAWSVAVLLVMFTPYMYYKLVKATFDSDCSLDLGTQGQFGDMFGAMNAVCSLVAVVGLLYTLRQQQAQLMQQQGQIRDQRLQSKKATHAQSMQLVWDILQDEKVRKAREVTLFYSSVHYQQYYLAHQNGEDGAELLVSDKLLKSYRESVCTSYDFIAILVADRVVSKKTILKNWGPSIVKCWYAVKAFVLDERGHRGQSLWKPFEDLAGEASEMYQAEDADCKQRYEATPKATFEELVERHAERMKSMKDFIESEDKKILGQDP